ncbi:MAG: hypothetical protein RRZ84_07285 [Romboutsia sp.]
MSRIDNLSDQLEGYTEEVVNTVISIENRYKFSRREAIDCVEIATKAMMVDVEHHKEANM